MSFDKIKIFKFDTFASTITNQKHQLLAFAKDIKISHTLFALPFVGTGLVMFLSQVPSISSMILIVLCMFFARSFAMGANRYLDYNVDKFNPRTMNRQIPIGNLSPFACLILTVANGILFMLASSYFGELCLVLSPVVLLILLTYSMLKRWVWWTHIYLGVCLGLSPLAAFVALENAFPPLGLVFLSLGVCFWTAGFDLLYATQDFEFDRKHNLNSAATVFGIRGSVYASRLSFITSILFFILAGAFADFSGVLFWSATALMTIVLCVEHYLISDLITKGSSKYLNRAFFELNAFVSLSFFILVFFGRYLNL